MNEEIKISNFVCVYLLIKKKDLLLQLTPNVNSNFREYLYHV